MLLQRVSKDDNAVVEKLPVNVLIQDLRHIN